MHNLTNLVLFAFGWNLIGYSAVGANFTLSSAVFTNSTNSYSWDNAVAAGAVQAYLSYYDASPATASQRKYKYVSAISGFDDTMLRTNKGYWIYANSSGNLTLLGVGGSYENATYDWTNLYFRDGTGAEKNIIDADTAEWIDLPIKFWNPINRANFDDVSENLNSWQGYFIYSWQDNMTLLRQN